METKKFIVIPKQLISDNRLTTTQKMLYIALLNHYNKQTNTCCPSIKTLSKELNLSKTVIKKEIDLLQEKGFIGYYTSKQKRFYIISWIITKKAFLTLPKKRIDYYVEKRKQQQENKTGINFIILPNEILKEHLLTPSEKIIYGLLLLHANKKTGGCFPSIRTLSKESGFSKKTIVKALSSLEHKQYIKREKKGKKNNYKIAWIDSEKGNTRYLPISSFRFVLNKNKTKNIFTKIPFEIITNKVLTASDKIVFAIILFYSNKKTKFSFPSIKMISKFTALSIKSVRRSIKKLIEHKFITETTENNKKLYLLNI